MKARTLLQGAGVAALVMFPIYGVVISSPSTERMHTPAPLTMFALSLIANLLLVSIVSALVGFWLRSRPESKSLKILSPGVVFASLAEAIYINMRGFESVHFWLIACLAVTALAGALHFIWRRGERLLFQASSATLMGLGFYCLFVMMQLLHLAMWRPLPNSTLDMPTTKTTSANHPRVIWILFDELSYDQVFEHRYPSLDLPYFDKFRAFSTLFIDTLPVANATEKAITSILLGQPIEQVNFTEHNQLEVASASGVFHPFDAAQTPFAVARQQGLTTGVDGWYNPYCSVLAPYLNDCYWTDELVVPSAFAREGFWQNLFDPWLRYSDILHHVRHRKSLGYRVQAYQKLMLHAGRMLQPSGPDFVFLHLPLPHPPGIYDRRTRRFNTSGKRSYVDNLALADRTLGQLLAILQQSPDWKNTSVVICGDHSWRVGTWVHSRYWTAEDEAASRGRVFDQRPLIMVHLAGQTTPATMDSKFPLIQLHNVLDDLVQGKQPSFASASH